MQAAALARRVASSEATIAAAAAVALQAADHAAALDEDSAFPHADVVALHRAGLLLAPFPVRHGGEGLASGAEAARTLGPALRRIGSGSLPLGRLYEGHANAIGLVLRYGSAGQVEAMAAEARAGALFGVWNTDDSDGLRLIADGPGRRLRGRKILCSGAGFIERPLVTARDEAGQLLMVIPKLERGERADLSGWTVQGMRASATGTVDFTGIAVAPEMIVGADGDYHGQPAFSGGAWRFAAVHQGGMEALLDLLRAHLVRTGRGGDAHQSVRLGHAAMAVETARMWVEQAALMAETGAAEADAVVAYVNLARLAVERAGLDLMELVHRSVGLAAFVRPNPIERITRDLATYLRQPAPDRALTTAAAWVLGRDARAADLWR